MGTIITIDIYVNTFIRLAKQSITFSTTTQEKYEQTQNYFE